MRVNKLYEIERAQQVERAQQAIIRAQGAVARCRAALERAKDIMAQSRAEYRMLRAGTEETIARSKIRMRASSGREAEPTEEAGQSLLAGEDSASRL
jgi:hypothetical protein